MRGFSAANSSAQLSRSAGTFEQLLSMRPTDLAFRGSSRDTREPPRAPRARLVARIERTTDAALGHSERWHTRNAPWGMALRLRGADSRRAFSLPRQSPRLIGFARLTIGEVELRLFHQTKL